MIRKSFHYISSLIAFCVLAFVYHLVVVAWLRPIDIERMPIAPMREMVISDTLADLFPEGAWQRQKCKRLQTADGMLLFQNWEQSSADQWKLWPMTVLIGRGAKGMSSTSPVVIDSVEGAEIKFAGSLDVMSGGAPPIQRGRMIGEVKITRHDSTDPSKTMSVHTSNVGMDNQKIWTTEAIHMNVGKAEVIGRDMTIHLATNAASQTVSRPTSAASRGVKTAVLDRMELIYLEQCRIPLENGGLWPAAIPKTKSGASTPYDPKSMLTQPNPVNELKGGIAAELRIECKGRMEYDFAIDKLMLRDKVSFVHQIADAETDRFDCDTLEMSLRDPTNREIDRNGGLDWVNRIKATGSPLVARLPNLDLEIAAGQIDLQARKGLVRADGLQGIEIHRGGIHARLESIVYQYDPASPETLGAIDARGIGIVTIDDPKLPIRKASWSDGFKLQPLGPITKATRESEVGFWIDGDVQTTLVDGGVFRSHSVEGVLKPDPRVTPGTPTRPLVPDRVAASGSVHLDTSSIQADTDQLRLFFVEPEPSDLEMIEGDSLKSKGSIRQLVLQPDANKNPTEPVARTRPTVAGKTITAKLLLNEKGVHAKDLSVIGSVRLTHTVELGGQPMEAKLVGEQLRLIDGGGEDVLQLGSGVDSPARFELGDGYFVGPMIQIRPSDNIVWINQAGEFQIPTQALPTGLVPSEKTTGDKSLAAGSLTGNQAPASRITWSKPPLCRWLGEMVFDGKSATLTDGVEISASVINDREPWDIQIAGDRMEIVLLEGVEVRDLKTMKAATVQRIDLLQSESRPVVVQAVQRAGDGLIESKHILHAEKLTMVPADGGKLFGSGPGWYRCWSRADVANAMPGKREASEAPKTVGADRPHLTGIHLVFHDTMQGDLANKTLDFMRGVRVGVREVANWDDAFDAAQMEALSAGQTTLDCDHLRFSVSPSSANLPTIPGLATPWETEASGGVVFRSRNERGLFECSAARAAYSAGKDMFTMHGEPNRPALFRQQNADGQSGPEWAVKTLTLKLKTMEVENMQLERISIAAPPGALRPN